MGSRPRGKVQRSADRTWQPFSWPRFRSEEHHLRQQEPEAFSAEKRRRRPAGLATQRVQQVAQ